MKLGVKASPKAGIFSQSSRFCSSELALCWWNVKLWFIITCSIIHFYIGSNIMLYNQFSFDIYCILSPHRCGCFALSPGGKCPLCFSWWGCGSRCGTVQHWGAGNGVKSLQRKTTSSAYKAAVTSAKCDLEWAEQAGGGTGATACPGRCVSAKHLQWNAWTSRCCCYKIPTKGCIGLETHSFSCV